MVDKVLPDGATVTIEAPGAVYHVMARGEGGKDVFEEDADCSSWLERLGQACEKHGWRVHAWVLMGNHFHLLLETPEPNLVAGMKWFMGVFSQGWNIRRKRRGHVFQGRYKAVVVNGEGSGEYFRIVADYIHLNPVRSGWVGGTSGKKLAEWRWSSFRQYSGRVGYPWLVRERVLKAFELDQGGRGRRSYAGYLEARARDREGALGDEALNHLRRGWYLGDESFRDQVLEFIETLPEKVRRRGNTTGAALRAHDMKEAERLASAAMVGLGVEDGPEALRGRGRLIEEKAMVAWLMRTRTGVSNEWVAKRLEMGHPSSVSRAVKMVETSRKLQKRALDSLR